MGYGHRVLPVSPLGFGSLKDFRDPVKWITGGFLTVCVFVVALLVKVMFWGVTIEIVTK